VNAAKSLGLETIVCAQSPDECEKYSEFDPDYIAFEPPELIGGSNPVSEAKPGLIEEAVERSEVDVLTGAGIKSKKDVEKSIELGCRGVLVASGVVKANDIYGEVKELCEGL
jgi:triosephosphate isomerase